MLLLSRKVWIFQVVVRNQYLGIQPAATSAVNVTGGLLEMGRSASTNLKFHLVDELTQFILK